MLANICDCNEIAGQKGRDGKETQDFHLGMKLPCAKKRLDQAVMFDMVSQKLGWIWQDQRGVFGGLDRSTEE